MWTTNVTCYLQNIKKMDSTRVIQLISSYICFWHRVLRNLRIYGF
uniref:Uncharacterized protein n=1 Tax=Rhizophora mucronata TaxID=61149 RepID=A0A2P2PA99_RHIMU